MFKNLAIAVVLLCMPGQLAAAQTQQLAQFQKNANEALKSQLSQEGRDCPGVRNNLEDKECIAGVEQQAEKDSATFYNNLRALLSSTNQMNLEEGQKEWLAYRQKSCDAVAAIFQGGSGQAGFVARCDIQLTRSRMKDLDAIYAGPLHR